MYVEVSLKKVSLFVFMQLKIEPSRIARRKVMTTMSQKFTDYGTKYGIRGPNYETRSY